MFLYLVHSLEMNKTSQAYMIYPKDTNKENLIPLNLFNPMWLTKTRKEKQ